MPDAKTLGRIGQAIGPGVIRDLHERLVKLAQEQRVIRGRKMRVDTTVVETNIHYPTDSSLLGDGTRVLTRTLQKIETEAGGLPSGGTAGARWGCDVTHRSRHWSGGFTDEG